MEHTFDELKKKTVAQLREIAKGNDHDALHGYTTMHKEQLVLAVCQALGLEDHEHHEVLGIDKSAIKAKIRELKVARAAALTEHDRAALKATRRNIHSLKRKLRRATV